MLTKIVVLSTIIFTGLMQPSSVHYVNDNPVTPIVESFIAEVSAYTNSPDETDSDNMITASGEIARGNIVACPSRYKFGTKIKIKDKVFICEDRMNVRYRDGNFFDILVETKNEAYNWGRQKIVVSVLSA